MVFSTNQWPARQSYYDSLALRNNGDDAERYGATQYGIDKSFVEYEALWRYHVAPATQRPTSALHFNAGTHVAIVELAQRSYTVFSYLLEANEYLAAVKSGTMGPRYRNWYNTIMYAGNALQVFSGLQETVEQALATAIGRSITLFPDWVRVWNPGRESVVNYRNYVTHQGRFQFFEENGAIFVLKRSEVTRTASGGIGWHHSDTDFQSQRGKFAPVADVASETVKDTTDWLNNAYKRINATLAPLLQLPIYQSLWGWSASGYVGTATTPANPSPSVGVSVPNVGLSGVNPIAPQINLCATTSPPPKKEPPQTL